ncbi:MAG: TetR/AcrR family transcriptional regulator [Ruminococcus sp.]
MPSFTKDAIKKSFLKLLNEKQLNKITVKDIVEDCGINRNSFYYHYDDILSLLEEILTEETEALMPARSKPSSIYECLISAIEFALKNRKAVMHIYNSPNKEMIERYLNRVSQHAVSSYINSASSDYDISENDKEAIILYYKSLLIGFVVDWISSGMRYDLGDKIKRICEIFDGSMERAFIKSSRSHKDNQ